MSLKVVAIIPARAGSARVKDKNLQIIGGFSLVERKIRQLETSSHVSEIVLGTNCPTSAVIARKREATVVKRDEYHCDEKQSSANEMILDLASRVDADIIIWCHCTNPFLYGRHYDHAVETFLAAENAGYDSLLSVQKVQSHMWSADGLPINYDPYAPRHTLAKDIPPVYIQDGGIFIQRSRHMVSNSYFFGAKPKLMDFTFPFTHDINTIDDLEIARAIAPLLDTKEAFLVT